MPRRFIDYSWPPKLRPGRPLLQVWILSAVIVSVSNTLAQVIDAYKKEEAFEFDIPRLLRFVCLDLITAPLNYKWQELLEKTFPRHGPASSSSSGAHDDDYHDSIPLVDRDVEKASNADEEGEDDHDHEPDVAEGSISPPSAKRKKKRTTKEKNTHLKAPPPPPPPPPTKQNNNKKKNWKNIWTKWLLDCVTLGALFNTVAFLAIMGVLNGRPASIPHSLRTQTLPIIVDGYKIWPIANIVAHSVVAFERRVPFFAAVALAWNVYLSLVAARL